MSPNARPGRSTAAALLAVGAVTAVVCPHAQAGAPTGIVTQGTPFVVNSYTTGSQSLPAVAMSASGEFVVVWESDRATGTTQDGDGRGVFARTFDSTGAATSGEFRVNGEILDDQQSADVTARDGAGTLEAVVVWNSVGQDGDADGVFLQSYRGATAQLGDDFLVNTFTTGVQNEPSVLSLSDGDTNAVVCSRQERTQGADGDVYCRTGLAVFDAAARARSDVETLGAGVGSEILVNTFTTGDQTRPDACALASDRFVVVWTSIGQDGSTSSIVGRRVDTGVGALDDELAVNAFTSGTQDFARVCCSNDGFVVTWQGNGTGLGSDGNLSGIFARRFDSTAAPYADEMLINVYTTGQQSQPSIACDADGNFVVAWTDLSGPNSGIIARAFRPDGSPAGGEVRLTSSSGGLARNPDVAMSDVGRFVVAWNKSFADGNSDGVQVQRARIAGIGPTTTSTSTSSTLPATTTTTTLEAQPGCGDPIVDVAITRAITAVDALLVLRASIGAAQCLLCICDVNDSGSITATDALFVLRAAVGQPAPLTCPPCQ